MKDKVQHLDPIDNESSSTVPDQWRNLRAMFSKMGLVLRSPIPLVAVAVLIIIGFMICAIMLIPQAIENGRLAPASSPRMRPMHEQVCRSSWIVGMTSIAGIFLNAAAVVMLIRHWWLYGISLIAISVLAFGMMSLMFSPFS